MAAAKVPPRNVVTLLELKKRCRKSDMKKFRELTKKRDQYVTRLQALEESGAKGHLPPIDWEFYKRNVRSEAVSLVEDFEKKYTSFTVPQPEDKHTPQLEKLKEDIRKEILEFVNESNRRIQGYQKEIERIKSLLPFEQMTWEDYIDAYPKTAPKFIENPTFWPHDPPEQLGYLEEEVFREHSAESVKKVEKSKKASDKSANDNKKKKPDKGADKKAEPKGSPEPKKK